MLPWPTTLPSSSWITKALLLLCTSRPTYRAIGLPSLSWGVRHWMTPWSAADLTAVRGQPVFIDTGPADFLRPTVVRRRPGRRTGVGVGPPGKVSLELAGTRADYFGHLKPLLRFLSSLRIGPSNLARMA